MNYATQQDMVERFGELELAQLSDRTNGEQIDAAIIERALTDAAAEINAYLGVRYSLPLDSLPVVLVRLNADMARYHLYDDKVTEAVHTRYKGALDLLKNIANGTVQLPAATLLTPATGGNAVAVKSQERQFDAAALQGY